LQDPDPERKAMDPDLAPEKSSKKWQFYKYDKQCTYLTFSMNLYNILLKSMLEMP
jgi:hypothetical protein